MIDVLLFGGTSEGRTLARLLQSKGIPTLVCVATEYGEALLEAGGSLSVHTGRLGAKEMLTLLQKERPRRVVDATHPYASAVSDTLKAACRESGADYMRVRREPCKEEGCIEFSSMPALVSWLNTQQGTVFSMLGAKEAAALSAVNGYRERMWLRILPSIDSLHICLAAGFSPKHIICMQGPFSEEMNAAMLHAANASIALTKESGAAGGFPEKLAAAKRLGIPLAVLQRPEDTKGCTLPELMQRIEEGSL
mgnify:CR=1 FL=1